MKGINIMGGIPMKKLLTSVGLLSATALTLVACGDNENDEVSGNEEVSVGVLQFMEHNSLSAAQNGFIQALEDNGYTEGENLNLATLNAQGDQANLQQMSQQLSADNDLMLTIATPTAQSMMQVESQKPILFTAVTDPVDAGLVDSMDQPGRNATGTSDMMPVDAQIDLLLSLDPQAENVGVIYNASEANSEIQANQAIDAIEASGLTPVAQTVSSTNDVQQVLNSLANDIELLYVPTDNTLASTAPTIGQVAANHDIPVVAGSIDQVEEGGVATYSIDYESLGYQTGEMAIDILNGADPAETPVQTAENLELYINEEMAREVGLDPESIQVPAE